MYIHRINQPSSTPYQLKFATEYSQIALTAYDEASRTDLRIGTGPIGIFTEKYQPLCSGPVNAYF
jgi:hypothetical protein